MPRNILLTLLVIFNSSKLCSQNLNAIYKTYCTYELSYQPDSTDVNSRKNEIMVLLIGDNYSLFKSQNKLLQDSARTFDELNNSIGSMSFAVNTRTNFNYSIFKNSSDNISTLDFIRNDVFEYKEKKSQLNWQIKEETTIIGKLSCIKAVTNFSGRKWTAWFSPEIPIPDGPYKFNGLPGLIVDIADETGSYRFSLLQLENKTTKAYFPKSLNFISISKTKYFEQLKYYNEHKFEMDQLQGVTFTSGQEQFKKRFEELAKKNNNPLELRINE